MKKITKTYFIVLVNFVIIFCSNWYIKFRIAKANKLLRFIKINSTDFSEKERVYAGINQINEIGFGTDLILLFSGILFFLNSISLKYVLKTNLWFLKALFVFIITIFGSFLFYLSIQKTS
ncbi:membrane hypothetical protein [Tenacibaculum maritimum]|nr:membrane hypothetical protein [Tenacibaculum maritimum]CAA0222925.1 membrane hypothetical protein [Tenacibaculum maritimum]CAA0224168.1 membrane hypothetical protein [Tenacibaculum maritimum]CAA0224832.1 membrane hypothetical protein [Tenacibaculum maritimum]CAA0249849.1 membrane hypothetical protein [Tenacibaculum maritimum]